MSVILKEEKIKEKSKEIIDEYMNLIRCSSPYCNCGKCITRKYKGYQNNNNYDYLINKKEKEEKEKDQEINILKNKTGIDDNQNNSIIKVYNNDYYNDYKNQINQNKRNHKKANPPFIGRSSYELMFPNWQLSFNKSDYEEKKIFNDIPFNGNSSYKENFNGFEKRYYLNRVQPIFKSDNLESKGEIMKESISRENYRPVDFKNYKKINNYSLMQIKRPTSIIPAPYSKDSFLSSYERAFMLNNLNYKKEIIVPNLNNNQNNSLVI
jgi:hypothetical protein